MDSTSMSREKHRLKKNMQKVAYAEFEADTKKTDKN